MSKRDALRALSRKFPAPKEVREILDELRNAPDRIVAIVASALTEAFLEKFIIARLATSDAALIGNLFQNKGPMSDFHSKILIAQAFGLISRNQADEFHRIKVIRNVFAHATLNLSFETEEIAKEVDDFIMHKAMREARTVKTGKDLMEVGNFTRKSVFLLMAHISCIIMDHDRKDITGDFLAAYE